MDIDKVRALSDAELEDSLHEARQELWADNEELMEGAIKAGEPCGAR